MHDSTGFIRGKNGIKPLSVQQITLLERSELDRVPPPGAQIVKGDRQITRIAQSFASVRTDIARPSRHQYSLHPLTPGSELLRRQILRDDVAQVTRQIVPQIRARQTE